MSGGSRTDRRVRLRELRPPPRHGRGQQLLDVLLQLVQIDRHEGHAVRTTNPASGSDEHVRRRHGPTPPSPPEGSAASTSSTACACHSDLVRKVLLIVLCFFFPFLAVLIAEGPTIRVLWAFLLQLLGHFPGVIYGIYRVTRD